MTGAPPSLWLVLAFIIAAAATYAAILALRPMLLRVALAKPNARSSHKTPTPQGGGLAVVAVTVVVVALAVVVRPALQIGTASQLLLVGAATLLLVAISAIDDIRGLAALPRLAMHIVGVAIMLAALPTELRLIPALPLSTERALLLIVVVGFINFVNFMDGIDWITVAEVVPICAGLIFAGAYDALPPLAVLTATVLAGAMIGFAPFNRPVATLFLGDVGSIPIGLLMAWLLLQLAGSGNIAAALLLPLYYLADATITLGRRLARGEPVWQAHRTHFYQIATDRGYAVIEIVALIAIVNVALLLLALATIAFRSVAFDWIALAIGCVLVAGLLRRFTRGPVRREQAPS